MYRGTTPTFVFRLPIDASLLTRASISFHQVDGTQLDKTLDDCTIAGNALSCSLTEKETLTFYASSMNPMKIQLRVAVGESRMASQIFKVPVNQILKEGLL